MLESRDCYRIKNMVRSITSRVQRQGSATRHRAALWIIGRKVLPNVPLLLKPAEFERHKLVLISKVVTGEISIVRPDGVRIDSLNDGTLIYFPPNKPATLTEPPMGDAAEPSKQEGAPTGLVVEENAGSSDDPTCDCHLHQALRGEETPGPEALEAAAEAPVPLEAAPEQEAAPAESGVVDAPSSDKITAELPVPDEEGPRICTKCRELPAMEGGSLCIICVQPMKDEASAPAPAEEEQPVVAEPEPALQETTPVVPAVEPAAEPERRPKKKGKKS